MYYSIQKIYYITTHFKENKFFKDKLAKKKMETTSNVTHISIIDDFNARKIYEGMVFYSRNNTYRDKVEVVGFKADNKEHQWREETYRFKDTNAEAKLTYYSFPSEIPKQCLPLHTLEMEISGDKESREKTIDELENITGIKIRKDL